jgi:transcription initiation factor TFIIIB Brf1 subunit/transcription initiation factor TFIIB
MSNLIQLPRSSDSECPTCGSTNTVFDTDYGFHKCNACEHIWGLDKDDSDYDECDDELKVFEHEQGNWKKIRVKADEY